MNGKFWKLADYFFIYGVCNEENSIFYISIFSYFSRKNEYEADAYAKELTGDASTMISFLKKISANELTNINPHPYYEMFYYSHPSVLKRIKALKS